MKELAKLTLLALICYIVGGSVISCTHDDEPIAPNEVANNGTRTFSLVFNGHVNGYADKATRAGSKGQQWKDGSSVFVKFHVNDTSYVSGIAEYRAKPNTWAITFTGDLPATVNGKCSVFYTDSIVSTSGDSLVNLSRTNGAYMTETAAYSFNGIEMSIVANLEPMNGRIRFLGDSIESVKVVGLTSLSSFNAKTFEFKTDSSEVMLNCTHANAGSSYYYTDYIYGVFTDTVTPALYIESKQGAFRRSCSNIEMTAGSSGYIRCPQEDDYNGWTIFSGSESQIFSDAVDLGLSVLWSKSNLGAEYEYDYGYYTSWGDADGTNTKTISDDGYDSDRRWIPLKESYTGLSSYDRATKLLGNKWFTPSNKEWEELLDCDIKYTSNNNVNGYKIIGKNGNTIFLPLAGSIEGYATSYNGIPFTGSYWSSSYGGRTDYLYGGGYYHLYHGSICSFSNSNSPVMITEPMYKKCSIRPVCVK